jgi:hypothetical protein
VAKKAFFAVVTVVLLLEAGFRLASPFMRPLGLYSYQSDVWQSFDNPIWEVWHRPNKSIVHETGCFEARYSSNSFGMKDKPRSFDKKGPRVAVLGDSFAEGYGVDNRQTFSSLLEEKHFAAGTEFLNFGTSGAFGTIQEWLLYKNFVRKFKPDVVLVAFLNNNDVTDNSWWYWQKIAPERRRPYLLRHDGEFELFYPETKSPYDPATPWSRFLNGLSHRSFAARYLFEARERVQVSKAFSEMDWRRTTVYRAHPNDRWRESWEATEAAFVKLNEEVTADHAKLLIVNLPAPEQVDPRTASRIQALPDHDLFYPNTRMENLARMHGIAYFAPYADFVHYRDAKKLRSPYFSFTCNDHWSPLGHEVAAESLAAFLKDSGLLNKREGE